MTFLRAQWTRLPLLSAPSLHLSSHTLAVVDSTAYVFSGELVPRTPVPSSLSIVSLLDGATRTLPASPTGPAPRVGSALVAHGHTLYLWGGRGGKDMSPFSSSEDLWAFDTRTESWSSQSTSGAKPEQRSFHVLSLIDDTIYLHAGCPPKGRLPSLHALHLPTMSWTALPPAPGPGRGGPALTALPGGKLARFGGFAGHELGGLDVFSSGAGSWDPVPEVGQQPEKRSVAGFESIETALKSDGGDSVVAVLFLGEREGAPAELGHDGAGAFHADAWALLSSPVGELSWVELKDVEGAEKPEARGWFAAARWGKDKVVIHGGLNERNERLEDMWVLEVVRQ